jgi:hypothetical protein
LVGCKEAALPVWLAYFLGFLTWLPLTAFAVLTGRWLAKLREVQSRPSTADAHSPRPAEPPASAAPPAIYDRFDDWAKAWADALS